jgi:hypothetical protein
MGEKIVRVSLSLLSPGLSPQSPQLQPLCYESTTTTTALRKYNHKRTLTRIRKEECTL